MIFAGVNGYLDPMPVDQVRPFEQRLLRQLRDEHADISRDALRRRSATPRKLVGRSTSAKLEGRQLEERSPSRALPHDLDPWGSG